MTHTISGSHLIDGQWVRGGGATFNATNPANGEILQPSFGEADARDVDTAAKSAAAAFDACADLPPKWSADLLEAIAMKIMDLGDALLERAEAETALARPRLIGERGRTVNQLKLFAEIVREGSWVDAVIDTADPDRNPAPKPDLRRMFRPRGPAAVFGASNFPFAYGALGGDSASALATGCPVIVKGHPSHPGTSELYAAAVLAAVKDRKLPAGMFSLLQGRSHELSGALVKHPAITAVGFTGSLKAGRALFDIAAARPVPIPVFAEMGSLNPLVILPGAIAERGDRIAQDLANSVLLGGGQFCTKPGLVFTVGQDDAFIAALTKHVAAFAPSTMLNSGLRDSFRKQTSAIAGVSGVKTIIKGDPINHAAMTPSLYQTDAATWKKSQALHEEAFGPGAVVIHCDSIADLVDCLDHIEGSLTGTVHIGSADKDAGVVLRRLQARVGRLIANGYPTGVEVNNAIVHGGPYPATTDAGTTSVGSAAIRRWVRLIAFQDMPDALLPPALQNVNPLGIERIVNGKRTSASIS